MPYEGAGAMTAIDTGKVGDFRSLRFTSIDDLLAEVDRIAAADAAGTLRRSGNWTTGQVFGHLASWINYGYEGFPAGANPPWFIKLYLRMMKAKLLRDGFPRGMKIPRLKEGTFGTEPMSTEEGARRLREALMRIKNGEPAKFHSPGFGQVPEKDRIEFQFRHAECHLGYLHP
jgi:hypothetical protein